MGLQPEPVGLDRDGRGDACDNESPLDAGTVSVQEFDEGYDRAAFLAGTPCRVKRQVFTATFNQAGLFDVIRYQGSFRVCYLPHIRVVWVRDMHGDVTWTQPPWTWQGNDPGYPYGVITGRHTAEFHYRGSAAICIFKYGCAPTQHPWVRVTFTDDNTMGVTTGVV